MKQKVRKKNKRKSACACVGFEILSIFDFSCSFSNLFHFLSPYFVPPPSVAGAVYAPVVGDQPLALP